MTSLVANTAEEKRTPMPCRSFTDDPDAPGCCAGCGDAREAHCRVCGGAGHVYDVLGHGPWDCWECRPKRNEAAKADPLSEDSLQVIICSPNFRDYEKVMARELLLSRNSFDALTEANKKLVAMLRTWVAIEEDYGNPDNAAVNEVWLKAKMLLEQVTP